MEVSGYNLSWSTFSRHLAQLSRELHSEKYFSDVTLVSDDLVQTEAHRIILSASSPLLKSLLMISPRGQTQLFLKGVKHQQLEAVLKFLYYGEVTVPSDEINEFLRAGTELDITELICIMEKRGDGSEEGNDCENFSNFPEEFTENILNMKEEEEMETKEADGQENVSSCSGDKVGRKISFFVRHGFFGEVRKTDGKLEIRCRKCSKEKFVSYQNKNVNCMKAHLKSAHPEDFKRYEGLKKRERMRDSTEK